MGVTTLKSAEVTAVDAGGLANWQQPRTGPGLPLAKTFAYTQAGAGDQNSTADLCYLPPGNHRIYSGFIDYPTMTNGALQIGHAGYTQNDGTVVAASATALLGSTTTTAAGRANVPTGFFDYNSVAPLKIVAKFTGTGGVADTAAFTGVLNFTRV
jgi:hypothetical protein